MGERNNLTDMGGLNILFQDLAFGQKHALSALTKYLESDTSSELWLELGRAANSELIAALVSS